MPNLHIPARAVGGDQEIAATTDNSGGEAQHFFGGSWANVSAQITTAQPTPGTPVAGGTVGGAADYGKANNIGVVFRGHTASGSVVIFEVSDDGTNWVQVPMQDETTNVAVLSYTLVASTNRAFTCALGGMTYFRVRCTTFVASSNPTVVIDPGTLAFEPIVSAVTSNPPGSVVTNFSTIEAGISTTTSSALVSLVPTRAAVVASAATTHTATAGKTFKIKGLSMSGVNAAATQNSWRLYLRANPSGTATTTSPILTMIGVQAPSAVSGAFGSTFVDLDIDVPSSWSFALTVIASINSGTLHTSLWGIEY